MAWAVPVAKVPSIIKVSCEGIGALTALSMARDSFSEGKPIQGSLDLVSAGASGLGGTAKAGLEKVRGTSKAKLATSADNFSSNVLGEIGTGNKRINYKGISIKEESQYINNLKNYTTREEISQVGVNKVKNIRNYTMSDKEKLRYIDGFSEYTKRKVFYHSASVTIKLIDTAEVIDDINTGISIGKDTIKKVIEDCKNNEVFKASKDVVAGYTKYELQTNEEIYNDLSKYVSKAIKLK